MKKLFLILAATATISFGCSSTNSSSGYFGYNNRPENNETSSSRQNQEVANTSGTNAGWVNPMAQNGNYANNQIDYVYADYSYRYNPHVYVPVIVPWWNSYNGWVSYPFPGSHLSLYYTNFWGYNWYSPWYTFHPYHGGYWGGHFVGGYHNWYNQPVYSRSSRPIDNNTYRSFGANRGSYSNQTRGTVSTSSNRFRTGNDGNVSGRVESSSARNSSKNTSGAIRGSQNTSSSRENSSSVRSSTTNSTRGDSRTFRPLNNPESSSRTVSTPSRQGSTAGSSNTFRSGNDNSNSNSGTFRNSGSSSSRSGSSSQPSRSTESKPSYQPAPSSSGSSSSGRSSSGSSSSSGGSSSGRGSSSGSSSGRTR